MKSIHFLLISLIMMMPLIESIRCYILKSGKLVKGTESKSRNCVRYRFRCGVPYHANQQYCSRDEIAKNVTKTFYDSTNGWVEFPSPSPFTAEQAMSLLGISDYTICSQNYCNTPAFGDVNGSSHLMSNPSMILMASWIVYYWLL